MTLDPLLKISDLKVHFFVDEGVVKALDGIDLVLEQGETLAIVGESGCGKSITALSIMQLVPSPGKVVGGMIDFENQNLLSLREKQMRRIRGNDISMIFQEPMTSLNPVLKISEHLIEVIRLHRSLTPAEAFDHGVEMLFKVGISDPKRRMSDYPHQMSGGMRQRVMIAMALACDPKLIIADEPTTALDVTIQAQILDLMNQLKEDYSASIMLITHDLGVVAESADTVAVMYAGSIVERAGVVQLFDAPKHPYTVGLMESIPKLDEPIPADRMLKAISGLVPSPLNLPPGCIFRDRCSQSIQECKCSLPPLEETSPGHWVRCWLYAK